MPFILRERERERDPDIVDIVDQLLLMNNGEEPAYQYLSNLMKSDNFLQYSDFLKYMMVAYSIIYLTRQTSKYSPQRTPELLELYQFAVDSNTIGLNKFLIYKNT
ncbi:MAG: hypothetical protein ACI86M_002548 [Saprospiraceae bacterium]|jgi:hypothetical protein